MNIAVEAPKAAYCSDPGVMVSDYLNIVPKTVGNTQKLAPVQHKSLSSLTPQSLL